MTTRWENGDEHIKLIIEGERTSEKVFRSALDIELDGNILLDFSLISKVDSKSIEFLNSFAVAHKAKHFSIIATSPNEIKGLEIEVVPTMTEARDLIFMEVTERELGFFGEDEM